MKQISLIITLVACMAWPLLAAKGQVFIPIQSSVPYTNEAPGLDYPYVVVPAGQKSLTIVASKISGYNYDAGQAALSGDFMLYFHQDSAPPEMKSWRYRFGVNSRFMATLSDPPAGKYYIRVWSAYYDTPHPAVQVTSFTVTATIQ